ncbi:hypothetical protein T458_09375 [Brevibacillus panacihumi W25]|uniref:Uncharacterized protein n=1 Tax=Brevibacillus panacihumi W25 TaxID=1408254 RepID=V6M972_9BACL|nr:hypothetical protein T458_09375 [Brevibacillus panacihumi W25]
MGSLPGAALAGSTPKAEPRPKAADSKKRIQGWTLRAGSAFSVAPGLRSQMPGAYFPIFLTSFHWSPCFSFGLRWCVQAFGDKFEDIALGFQLVETLLFRRRSMFPDERLAESSLAEQRSPGKQKRNL